MAAAAPANTAAFTSQAEGGVRPQDYFLYRFFKSKQAAEPKKRSKKRGGDDDDDNEDVEVDDGDGHGDEITDAEFEQCVNNGGKGGGVDFCA